MKLKNQIGKIQVNYRIKHKQFRHDVFAAVELYVDLPSVGLQWMDSVTEIRFDTYTDNLKAALIEAEDRWNLKLIELPKILS